jgi:hypothetical protein
MNPKQQQFHVFSLRRNKGDQMSVPGIQFVGITAVKNHKDKVSLVVTLLPFAGSETPKRQQTMNWFTA